MATLSITVEDLNQLLDLTETRELAKSGRAREIRQRLGHARPRPRSPAWSGGEKR